MLWNPKWFPGTNLQDLNLDWILKKITALRGGTTGQVLYKKTDKDFDFGWKTGGGGSGEGVPIGGLTGEYLRKHSDADYDTEWAEIDIPQKVSDLLNDAGYITGLNTITYGASTYQDFINAFNANKIVFCKAYTGNDPSVPTNEIRMAYLRYVSSPVNPATIQFAYYRNAKNHSVSQQGDDIYIYTLTNTNEWSFEIRKTYTEIDVGTGLLKTYSNGKLTLSSTGGGGGSGVTFIPSVSSAGVISWTNDGGLPNPEPVNIKGPAGNNGSNGTTFTPSISSAGVISWTNDGGLPNPEPVNIKGPQGATGATGPAGPQGATGATGPAGPQGATGATGATGPAGPGVPAGGSTSQVLAKRSGANYDTEWINQGGAANAPTLEEVAIVLENMTLSQSIQKGEYFIARNNPPAYGYVDGIYRANESMTPGGVASYNQGQATLITKGGLNDLESRNVFLPGDTLVLWYTQFSGFVTASSTNISFTIITPKSMELISTVAVESLTGAIRGNKGYVDDTSDSTSLTGKGYTFTLTKRSNNLIHVALTKSAALTNVDNNTPVCINCNPIQLRFY